MKHPSIRAKSAALPLAGESPSEEEALDFGLALHLLPPLFTTPTSPVFHEN
jgi:hypothetical protein